MYAGVPMVTWDGDVDEEVATEVADVLGEAVEAETTSEPVEAHG